MDNREILRIAMEQSACDCSCDGADFLKSQNVVVESMPSEHARRYLKLPHICSLVSYGNNIVACGSKALLEEIRQYLCEFPQIERCFETPGIYALNRRLAKLNAQVCYQAEYFLPDLDAVFGFGEDCGYELRILGPQELAGFYLPQWGNALCADRKNLDVLGVGAYDGETLVGLAGCSADCEGMWQIGIDVLPSYRRQGIASALTNRIARETFDRGKVPFYCAAWSNVKSVRNALRSGFKPAWAELAARPVSFVEEMLKEGMRG